MPSVEAARRTEGDTATLARLQPPLLEHLSIHFILKAEAHLSIIESRRTSMLHIRHDPSGTFGSGEDCFQLVGEREVSHVRGMAAELHFGTKLLAR